MALSTVQNQKKYSLSQDLNILFLICQLFEGKFWSENFCNNEGKHFLRLWPERCHFTVSVNQIKPEPVFRINLFILQG